MTRKRKGRDEASKRAICRAASVDSNVLRDIFAEVDALGLSRPITVYGYVCTMGETETFRFEQVTSGSPPGAAETPVFVCPGCGMTRSQRWPDDTTHPNMEKLKLRDGCYYGPVYGWYSCKVTGDLRAYDWGLSHPESPDGSRGTR